MERIAIKEAKKIGLLGKERMGGKGRRRRAKNYRAAHGGYDALPPPPDPSKLNALPSKLRQIISFTSSSQQDIKQQKKREGDNAQNTIQLKDKVEAELTDVRQGDTDRQLLAPEHKDSSDEQFKQRSTNGKNKKKRKRKEVKDLRFEMEVEKTRSQLKSHERKKKYLEARKKKHKKNNAEQKMDFPGHEKIKFGDIVKGPPKLNVIPKAFKNAQDASKERLRLQAVEEYRSRKGWSLRPGSHLPPPVTISTP